MTVDTTPNAFDTLPNLLRDNLSEMGILTPTAIQQSALGPVMEGRDFLGLSHTGSGKTLAFLLPMAVRLMGKKGLRAIVLTPTRELADQVGKVFSTALSQSGLRSLVITGGASYQRQKDSLRQGVDVVIGTPGRVVDLMNQGNLKFDQLQMFVLDEVDEMLDVGFADDIEHIRRTVPKDAQTVFFSATMGPRTRRVADAILKNPVEMKVSQKSSPSTIQHEFILVESSKTLAALVNNLIYDDPDQAIVFCETKQQCSELSNLLRDRGIPSQAINSDLGQADRRRTLDDFRSGKLRYLIATNVAARGIDIVGLPLVVNMEPPRNRDSYTHRAGRTGRAGASGRVWTMVTPSSLRKFQMLMRDIGISASSLVLPHKKDILLKYATHELKKMKDGLLTLATSPRETDDMARDAVQSLLPEEAQSILTGILAKKIARLNLDAVVSLPANERSPRTGESRNSGPRTDERRRSFGRSRDNFRRDERPRYDDGDASFPRRSRDSQNDSRPDSRADSYQGHKPASRSNSASSENRFGFSEDVIGSTYKDSSEQGRERKSSSSSKTSAAKEGTGSRTRSKFSSSKKFEKSSTEQSKGPKKPNSKSSSFDRSGKKPGKK